MSTSVKDGWRESSRQTRLFLGDMALVVVRDNLRPRLEGIRGEPGAANNSARRCSGSPYPFQHVGAGVAVQRAAFSRAASRSGILVVLLQFGSTERDVEELTFARFFKALEIRFKTR